MKTNAKNSIFKQYTLDRFFIENDNLIQIEQGAEIIKSENDVISEFPTITERITDIDALIKNNNLALEMIETGQINNEKINELFNGLGVEISNDEGLLGINKKRTATLQQYFTPTIISQLIVKVLSIPNSATVLDNTSGSGRMFSFIPNKRLITGIEIEERAYIVAKTLYPTSCIIKDDARYHIFNNNFDYSIINPPFSIQWYVKELECGGYKGSILSHIACLEIAIRAVKPDSYVAAILPSNIFKLDSTIKFHHWLMNHARLTLRINLPKDAFLRVNFASSIFFFKKISKRPNNKYIYDDLELNLDSLDNVEKLFNELQKWEGFLDIQQYAQSRNTLNPVYVVPHRQKELKRKSKKLPILDFDEITVSRSGNALSLHPSGLIAQLKVHTVFARMNCHLWDPELKCFVSEVSRLKSLNCIWSKNVDIMKHPILQELLSLNVKLIISKELERYIVKKRNWFRKQTIPFEQWVQEEENGSWKEVFQNEGVRTVLKSEYERNKSKLFSLQAKYTFINSLYDFQKDDIIRASLKDSSILCHQMGLGKTRIAITLILLRDVKHTLIILPTYLIYTWETELKNLNDTIDPANKIQYKIIKNENDCKDLKKVNIISYNTISLKKWKKSPHIIFADKLKRRFNMLVCDEAHALKAKETHRTKGVLKLKARYKIFLTGTPISNMVKNFWSMCDILFGSETPRFPYSTSDFRKRFVTVEMVTRQFDDTLCKGKTSQQLPKIKNLDEFLDLVKYMWIRRLKTEPEVEKNVKIVLPSINFKEVLADEEHIKVYKHHLDDFAELFIKYIHPELHEHDRVKAAVVLAQMTNLQFVSTIPQHSKFKKFEDKYIYKKDSTVIQKEVLQLLIEKHRKEKIIVISQRPDLCNFLYDILKNRGVKCGIFTGKVEIDKRNRFLDEFENSDLNILLTSINVIKEGLNLSHGTFVIIVDLDWTYQKLEQAYSRVLRPGTKRSPEILILYYKGFIDEYLWQHIRAKKSAVLSAVDRRIDTENVEWEHWVQFTRKMLEDLGYDLD